MKKYTADKIRNVCLLAHGGVGKTSLAEAACYIAKSSSKLGKTANGTSVFDARPDEKERKMTISMTIGYCEWKDVKINLLDCPGFLDLIGDTKAALRVVETAVMLVDASDGIQVGTEIGYRAVQEANKPRFFFINGMDKEKADFEKTLDSLKSGFGTGVAPVMVPIGQGASFKGVVDLITKEAFEYAPEGNGIGRKIAVPADMEDAVQQMRSALMESVAESDETLMNNYFEKGELTDEELAKGLAKGVAAGLVFPVACGSASLLMGIDELLSRIAVLAPSAKIDEVDVLDMGTAKKIPAGENQPAAGFIFKTLSEEHLGEIILVRMYAGKLAAGQELYNTGRNASERLGALYTMVGHERVEVSEIAAGDIGALLKLKDTHTGDTLADKTHKSIEFAKTEFPAPVISYAVAPKNKGDEDKVGAGIVKIHEEDPSFIFRYEPDIRQTVLSAMGDIHVDIITDVLKRRFKVEVERKLPRISYRETITKSVKYVDYTHKKQSGGAGQYAKVAIDMDPNPRGGGYEFLDKIVGGVIDQSFRPSVDKGIRSKVTEGIFAGYPIVDVKVALVDGKTHPVDSKDVAFQIAGREVFKKAFEMASPILLEPIVNLKVTIPDDCTGDVMGDLSSRRGRIAGMEPQGKYQVITGKVPEAEIQTYAQTLRAITQGRGVYTKSFSHYEPVPAETARKVIEASKSEQQTVAE